MFDRPSVAIVGFLVAAWLLQIWMSAQQMRRFHATSQRLRRMGTHMAVGVAGNMYRTKTYVALVIGTGRQVVAAERISGLTVFASSKPVPEVVGISLDEVGRDDPPRGVSPKTWAALDHAAGFIRKKLLDGESAGVGEEVT
jgi:DNA-binding transcriptional regulator of glucitol operon